MLTQILSLSQNLKASQVLEVLGNYYLEKGTYLLRENKIWAIIMKK